MVLPCMIEVLYGLFYIIIAFALSCCWGYLWKFYYYCCC